MKIQLGFDLISRREIMVSRETKELLEAIERETDPGFVPDLLCRLRKSEVWPGIRSILVLDSGNRTVYREIPCEA